jgi:Lar family restriction alleviation protein
MAKYKMKSCPFCFSTETRPDRMLGSSRFFHVLCTGCGAHGPLFEDLDSSKKGMTGAVKLWNKRNMTFSQD